MTTRSEMKKKSLVLDRKRHIQYFVHCMKQLPNSYLSFDVNRLTLLHFAIQSLDILKFFDDVNNLKFYNIEKDRIIDWIYSLQTKTQRLNAHDDLNTYEISQKYYCSGFKGGTFLGTFGSNQYDKITSNEIVVERKYDYSHIAMTYSALCSLHTLGDDFTRIDKDGIINSLSNLQLEDGSFQATIGGSENDIRFLYCACAISYMLNDWSGINIDNAVKYIQRCRSYDGAISLIPGQEGHGGSTFCAVASLFLMNQLDTVLGPKTNEYGSDQFGVKSWRNELVDWCVKRQINGMQGRPNKLEDTCYSYWIGGTLYLLGEFDLLNHTALNDFVLDCQTDLGGFSKLQIAGSYPDLLHSFYSLAWLSLVACCCVDTPSDDFCFTCEINQINCALGVRWDHTTVTR